MDALLVDDAPTKSMNRLPKEDGGAAGGAAARVVASRVYFLFCSRK